MTRLRRAFGLVAGAFILLSSIAHTFLGTPSLNTELSKINAPSDLASSIRIAWVFGGAAMLVLGCLTLAHFLKAFSNHKPVVSARAVQLIGLTYTAFGVWALVVSGMELFFLSFFLPGVVLLACARPSTDAAARAK